MMDRDKKDELPKMQGLFLLNINFNTKIQFFFLLFFLVGFIDSICLPLYKVKKNVFIIKYEPFLIDAF